MIAALRSAFTSHPATVGETYLEHSLFAARISIKLLAAGLAALVHAILPFAFEHTAGNMIRSLHRDMENR